MLRSEIKDHTWFPVILFISVITVSYCDILDLRL